MKNIQSFSPVALTALLLVSSVPVIAMDGPEYNFEGFDKVALELYANAKETAKLGVTYVGQKAHEGIHCAQDFYAANAPKAVAWGEKIAESVKDGFHKLLLKDAVVSTFPVNIPDASHKSQAVIPVQGKGNSSFKNFFNQAAQAIKNGGSQIKEAAQNHPIITGAVIAAVAVPLVFFGLKKLQKNRKPAVN